MALIHTKFHENLPSSSKVISGGTHRQAGRQTHGQTGKLISLL
jgi:hypothetical protein